MTSMKEGAEAREAEAPVPEVAVDVVTGEVLALREVSDERIVDFVGDAEELIEKAKANQDAAKLELRRRMDRDLEWTRRVGDPKSGVQYEITCPSTDAGTETYLPDELYDALVALVEDDIVSTQAAEGALKRTLTITLSVPLDVPVDVIADSVRQADGEFVVAGAALELVKVATDAKAHMPGVKTLRKVKAARTALDAIKRDAQPARRVRIKRIEKGA